MSRAEELRVLAEAYANAGVEAAKQGGSTASWYHNARQDIAHAANCFTVAAGLRALAKEAEHG